MKLQLVIDQYINKMSDSLPIFPFLLPPSVSSFTKQQPATFTRFYINDEKINRLERISFEKENLQKENIQNSTSNNENKDKNDIYTDDELIFQFDEIELN